jgi:hypothetical protein
MMPLFSKADKVADITYTISTSIVASGIFYLFTIFIPKISQVNRILEILIKNIRDIEKINEHIINTLPKSDNTNYSYTEFINGINIDNFEKDFNNAYSIIGDIQWFKESFNIQKTFLECILFACSDILTFDIKHNIFQFKEILSSSLQNITHEGHTSDYNGSYLYCALIEIIEINKKLKMLI